MADALSALCRECGFPNDHPRHDQAFVGSWMLAHPFSAPDAPLAEPSREQLLERVGQLEQELGAIRQVAEERAGRIVDLTLELRRLREALGDDHARESKTGGDPRKGDDNA